jgi:hypothetical protein
MRGLRLSAAPAPNQGTTGALRMDHSRNDDGTRSRRPAEIGVPSPVEGGSRDGQSNRFSLTLEDGSRYRTSSGKRGNVPHSSGGLG